ncbi:phage tail assembly chaperone [Pseudomonas typographi]|uniref:phage tail assembly chaperone n=1 Tax=Pseudomonas typographi TaxID=2715964 RepID=UPI0016838057|nr:phage tail assembly chaperone [Pseudomonas typographi]MBD1554712.1 hypothetical protein [Pseudomonas typographi]
MAKIKIAPNPTFDAQVMIPRVGSEALAVKFTFKYLDRLELAEFLDKQRSDGDRLLADSEGRSTLEQAKAEIEVQIEHLREIVASWDFDDELNDDSLRSLATTFSGSPDAVLKAYYEAYRQARLGN